MCLYSITAEYNRPLTAARACIVDDRYDLVECVDFLMTTNVIGHFWLNIIVCTNAACLGCANVFWICRYIV